MAFICEECHVKGTNRKASESHMFRSYGRCETCKKTTTCFDCGCWFKRDWNKPVDAPSVTVQAKDAFR